jgi:hypothetical protein
MQDAAKPFLHTGMHFPYIPTAKVITVEQDVNQRQHDFHGWLKIPGIFLSLLPKPVALLIARSMVLFFRGRHSPGVREPAVAFLAVQFRTGF